MTNTNPQPFPHANKRLRTGRNAPFHQYLSADPRPDRPRFLNPANLVNAVSSIAWVTCARALTATNQMASFNNTELTDPARTPVFKQTRPNGPSTHFGKDAVVQFPASQSGEKPSMSPTYHDTLFAMLRHDYTIYVKSNPRAKPPHPAPPSHPFLGRMVRAVRNLAIGDGDTPNFLPHPDVKRFQFCRKVCSAWRDDPILFQPSDPWNPSCSHHVIYALYSDAGIYIGYSAYPTDRCMAHLNAIFNIARQYQAGAPMLPLLNYDGDPNYKYHALARSSDPVHFVVLCELHPPATTTAIQTARVLALLPANIPWGDNFDLKATFAKFNVTPTPAAATALRHATQAWLTAGASIMEGFFITQMRSHCRLVLPSGAISTKRTNLKGFNDNAGIQAGKARQTLNQAKNRRRDGRQRFIVNTVNPPPHPRRHLVSLFFALFFPSRPILTMNPIYTAFTVKRFDANRNFVGSPLDNELKKLNLDTLREMKTALQQTNLNQYPVPLLTSAAIFPVPAPAFQPLSPTPVYPSRGAVRQLIMTLTFAISNKTFFIMPAPDKSDDLLATLDFINRDYSCIDSTVLRTAILAACATHHLMIPLEALKAKVGWRSTTPFGVANIFNHSPYSKYHNPAVNPAMPCNCHLLPGKFRDLSGCLSTNDPRVWLEPIFPQSPASVSLVQKLEKGTMVRAQIKLTPAESIKLLTLNLVRFQKVISFHCKDFQWPHDWGGIDAAEAWATTVAKDLHNTVTVQAQAFPTAHQMESLTPQEETFLRNVIKKTSVATPLEKSRNNAHWVCVKQYKIGCLDHLNLPAYTLLGPLPLPLDAPPTAQQAPGDTAPAIAHLTKVETHMNSFPLIKDMGKRLRKRAAGKRANATNAHTPPADPTIPSPSAPPTSSAPSSFRIQAKPKNNADGTRKHDGGRPISASGNSSDYPHDLLVTATEAFLDPTRDIIWQRTFTHPGTDHSGQPFSPTELNHLKSLAFPRFILRNTEAAIDLVKSFNRDRLSVLNPASRQPPSLLTLDFAAMYTNLPLEGQKGILANHKRELAEIEKLLQHHNLPCRLRYVIDEEGKYSVSFTKDPPCNAKGKPLVITLTQYSAKHFSFLLTNACTVFDGQLHRQVDGIAMGKSAAVLIANNATAWFELLFVRQLVSKRHFRMLFDLRYYARYIDDCLAINLRWIIHLRYEEDTYTPPEGGLPISGIYPHFAPLPAGAAPPPAVVLTLNVESSLYLPGPLRVLDPKGVTFLDSKLFWNHATRLLCWHTFDKRSLDKFDCTHFLRFPDSSSVLWPTCFHGIIHSEFGRFQVTNATLQLFTDHAGDLLNELYSRGYDWLKIWKQVEVFLKRHIPLYDKPRGLKPRQLKWITERALIARASWRYDTGLPLLHHRLQRLGFPSPTPTPIPPFPNYYPDYNPQHLIITAWIPFLPKNLA